MKTFKYFFLFLATFALLPSCEKVDTVIDRTTHLVTLENNTGVTGCFASGLTVTFLVSYRDIQVDVDIEEGRRAFINVLVEDNESINVKVQNTADDTSLADADVVVRTDSRPGNLADESRRITYCQAFNLSFFDF